MRNKSVSWSKSLKISISDYIISEIWEYEAEIASNRKSARYGEWYLNLAQTARHVSEAGLRKKKRVMLIS